ncbi:MAG: AMP-dependent synthetase/ligase [Clostridia bacterium]
MDKESKKLLNMIMKNFPDKKHEEENLKEMLEKGNKKTKKKLHKVEPITDLKDMLNKSYDKYKDKVAFKYKVGKNEIKTITYKEFIDDVNGLGTQLIKMGLLGKRIAVISENRYEWTVAYLATACGVGVVVPLDKSLPANEIESLIIRSGVEAIFYSKKYDEIMQDIKQRKTTDLRYYISMDLTERQDGVLSEREFIEKGKKLIEEGDRKFLDAEVDREGMTFMLFTSGTTAMSKAVMLSHKNICSNIMDIAAVLKLDTNDTLLSFLPLHHTFECTTGFLYPIYAGSTIAYCEGIRHIADNIKEFEISAMISVPALYEGMYKKVIKSIEKKGKLQEVEMMCKLTSVLSRVGLDFRKAVFKEIHEQLGGKLRLLVSGAAALDYEVEKGFNDLGFKMVQGYGLTETSPVIAAGNDFEQKLGSVGKVFPSAKIKIVNKNEEGIGEIYVKAPYVMLGYYQNEEATKEVLDKEWFKTGDLGYIDKKGFLFLCGRKKSVIVLKNGKNVFPEEIENVINRIDGIKESFVYGRPEPDDEIDLKLCAKIVYDRDAMKDAYGIEDENEIKDKIWEKIKELNKTMPPYKYIKEITVTEEELIKTTTQKIKRFEEMAKIQ